MIESKGAQKEPGASSSAPGPRAKPLSPAERRNLAEQYIPLVRSIAGKVKKGLAGTIEFDDLVDYGMIGLLEAAERFDSTQGANFMTFAYYRIRGAIYDGLRGMGWMKRSEYAKLRFEASANEYMAELAQAESADSGTTTKTFENALQDLAHAVQGLAAIYITTVDGAEGLQVKDQAPIAEERLGLEQARHLVRDTIKKLADQERQLLELYYYKDMSLEEAGEALGLSKSWTSRLHTRAIEKLHRLLDESLG